MRFKLLDRATGDEGWVDYDEKNEAARVEFPNERMKTAVSAYLTSPREFTIPESDDIDDFRIDKAIPTENETYMTLAMSSLIGTVGLWVDWERSEL
jgi:hypothetical protein